LPVPDDFENGEISEIEQKVKKDKNGKAPKGRRRRNRRHGRDRNRSCDAHNHADDNLNQGIHCQSEEAAANPGHGKIEVRLLGGFDGKLFP